MRWFFKIINRCVIRYIPFPRRAGVIQYFFPLYPLFSFSLLFHFFLFIHLFSCFLIIFPSSFYKFYLFIHYSSLIKHYFSLSSLILPFSPPFSSFSPFYIFDPHFKIFYSPRGKGGSIGKYYTPRLEFIHGQLWMCPMTSYKPVWRKWQAGIMFGSLAASLPSKRGFYAHFINISVGFLLLYVQCYSTRHFKQW